ncbi:protein phosphatase 2C domain-containing protein, partial [Streptomyces bobili]|uniref:protein phosphatase 2C domain-containing protein n=1 Tax=Streptomyces bobili TaxID=67280 RepID=UPI0033B391B0
PEAPPGTPPEAPPGTQPEAPPGTPPDASPGTQPEAPPGTPPEAPPGTPPEAPPGTQPEAPPGTPPDASPGTPPSSPPDRLSGPTGFLPGPLPPGFDEQEPQGFAPPGRTSPQTAPTTPATESQPPAGTVPTAPHPARPEAPPVPSSPPATPAPPATSAPSAPPFPQAPPGTPLSDRDDPRAPRASKPADAPRDPSDSITAAPTTPPRQPQPHGLPPAKPYLGSGPPTYDAEPTALPAADPDGLDGLVPDTVLDGARYGACTLRAASVRGDSARYRGEPRRDALLTARFGTGEQALILVAMATGARATPGAHRAAAEVCHWIGRAVGRSHVRLAEDMRAARRGDLKSGLHRLTDRSLGRLRASAVEQGLHPEEYAAGLRCLLLPADPACGVRVFFGVGPGGLFRLRDGAWRDIEPPVGEVVGEPVVGFGALPAETPEGDRLTMDFGIPTPPSPYEPAPGPPREPFRFRASVARPGDTLLMCTEGLAEPLRGEPELPAHLARRWSAPTPPGLAAFHADTQIRVKGYADDRTAAAVWEA